MVEKNFGTYEIPRFSWLPKLDLILVDNPDVPAQGGGEPPFPSWVHSSPTPSMMLWACGCSNSP